MAQFLCLDIPGCVARFEGLFQLHFLGEDLLDPTINVSSDEVAT